ncbi:hypothetical protein CAPTEDRAFT_200129 [Capitella teleta]|uniref:Uncharacterized protein n=1 Tax=Capitella teleta TaxID=283909 RepID=R7V9P2_CAPTE|nr:hypothetical protein CAPTEDRAFT_200129 [Capitella teleta]|eukprot:ELU13071.1 hypothetical protein CAPTEDRAFT_200129 [Capitella teleta]
MACISSDEEDEPARTGGAGSEKSNITLTLSEYMEAFLILIAVREERFPGDAGGMLKHLSTVQGLHKLFGAKAWLFYDRHFRLAKQHSPGISWDTADAELYMQAEGNSRDPRMLRSSISHVAELSADVTLTMVASDSVYIQHIIEIETGISW